MRTQEAIEYQKGKINYHKLFIGYYEDMRKNSDIGKINEEQIKEQIAYHKKILAYHEKRKEILMRGV